MAKPPVSIKPKATRDTVAITLTLRFGGIRGGTVARPGLSAGGILTEAGTDAWLGFSLCEACDDREAGARFGDVKVSTEINSSAAILPSANAQESTAHRATSSSKPRWSRRRRVSLEREV